MNKKFYLLLMFLIIIEQVIKLIINANYLGIRLNLFLDILKFNPTFNYDLSWYNHLFNLGINRFYHILFVIIMTLLLCLFYRYLKKNNVTSSIIDILFTFVLAGSICSLIDKVYWSGSLDYIEIKGLFIFDLKDIYLSIFNVVIIFLIVIDYKEINTILSISNKNKN